MDDRAEKRMERRERPREIEGVGKREGRRRESVCWGRGEEGLCQWKE